MLKYYFVFQILLLTLNLFVKIPLIITIIPSLLLLTEVTTMAVMDYIILLAIKKFQKKIDINPYNDTKKEIKKKFVKTSFRKINPIKEYNNRITIKRKDLHK